MPDELFGRAIQYSAELDADPSMGRWRRGVCIADHTVFYEFCFGMGIPASPSEQQIDCSRFATKGYLMDCGVHVILKIFLTLDWEESKDENK